MEFFPGLEHTSSEYLIGACSDRCNELYSKRVCFPILNQMRERDQVSTLSKIMPRCIMLDWELPVTHDWQFFLAAFMLPQCKKIADADGGPSLTRVEFFLYKCLPKNRIVWGKGGNQKMFVSRI